MKYKCFHCHKKIHKRKDCPEYKGKETTSRSGNTAIADGYDCTDTLIALEYDFENEWALDSECSYHICPNKDWFITYQSLEGDKVMLDDNKACKVVV